MDLPSPSRLSANFFAATALLLVLAISSSVLHRKNTKNWQYCTFLPIVQEEKSQHSPTRVYLAASNRGHKRPRKHG